MEQALIDSLLEHGRNMRIQAFEHALVMANAHNNTGGDLNTFIDYMTKKIDEEKNGV